MQRQTLPAITASMSRSLGLGKSFSSVAACMICPGWQYPHWGTCRSSHAVCNGCFPWGSSPSIVVTLAPAIAPTEVMQERVERPSTCTVHAPHIPIPQPNLVPVRPSSSRITQSNGVSSGLPTETLRPLIVKVVITNCSSLLLARRHQFPTYGSHVPLQVSPRVKLGARAAQIRRKPCYVSVGK